MMLMIGEADLEIEVSTHFLNKIGPPEIISDNADGAKQDAQQQEKVDQLKHKALNQ